MKTGTKDDTNERRRLMKYVEGEQEDGGERRMSVSLSL